MIIIDHTATAKLIQDLKSLDAPEGRHCIRFYPVGSPAEVVRKNVIEEARKYLPGAHVYFCEDGEIFLLAQATVRECRKAMLQIATAIDALPVESASEFYDLAHQSATLLLLLETKVGQQRDAEEAQQRRQAEARLSAQLARRRQEILGQGATRSAREIAAQRALRSEPLLMIIEDDPFSRRLVANVLQKRYQMTELESAENALAIYAAQAPDLLFLDINLPDVTGHELLEKIIALDPKAYVVMLSGNADKNNIVQAMQRGAVGFIAKPFSREKLFQYIDRCPAIAAERAQ